jgi:hypothetical protein
MERSLDKRFLELKLSDCFGCVPGSVARLRLLWFWCTVAHRHAAHKRGLLKVDFNSVIATDWRVRW